VAGKDQGGDSIPGITPHP